MLVHLAVSEEANSCAA